MCANGIMTVGSSPLGFYEGYHFPSNNERVRDANIAAPFWNDHDARASNVYYKLYDSDDFDDQTELQYVSEYISFQRDVSFDGTWMIIAQWVDVPPFPYVALRAMVSVCSVVL